MDMQDLLQQAMQMQEKLASAQQHAASRIVEGAAGGGMVRVSVTGSMQFTDVKIDPKCVDASDVEMLEDLVLAALHDATAKVGALTSASMEGLDLGGAMGGLGGLGGLLGGT
jgi:nucleoid-associated protein EbfC